MSDSGEQTTRPRLGTPAPSPRSVVLDPAIATRRADWSETGGNGWGYRGYSRSTRGYRRSQGDRQMSYTGRVKRESRLIYEELLKTPPIVLLILSCLAVLLVGAIVVGATR
jgi:hypothetical protein